MAAVVTFNPLALRRSVMLGQKTGGGDLYPVGTDIVQAYIRDGDGFESGHTLDMSNGDYITHATRYASPVYIPIDPAYTYEKNGTTIKVGCWYDASKEFISWFESTPAGTLTVPATAAYLRISVVGGAAGNSLTVTRTA